MMMNFNEYENNNTVQNTAADNHEVTMDDCREYEQFYRQLCRQGAGCAVVTLFLFWSFSPAYALLMAAILFCAPTGWMAASLYQEKLPQINLMATLVVWALLFCVKGGFALVLGVPTFLKLSYLEYRMRKDLKAGCFGEEGAR